jgi:hypothetical protein
MTTDQLSCLMSSRASLRPGGRKVAAAAPAASLLLLALAVACGQVGPPRPPVRLMPQAPSDLRVAQRGDRIEVSCRAPRVSVDGVRLTVLDVEVFVATSEGDLVKTVSPRIHRVAPGEALSEIVRPLPGPGTALRVAARARIKHRFSALTPLVELQVQLPPPPVTDLVAERLASGVHISWRPSQDLAPGSKGYWVYRRSEDGAYGVPVNAEPTQESAIDDMSTDADGAICYVARTVTASDPAIESSDSGERCLPKRPLAPLPPPHGLVAVPSGGNVELSWSCTAEPRVVARRVYRVVGEAAAERRAEIKAGRCSYLDEGVPTSAALHYTVTSVDDAGNESAPASFETMRPRAR